jgi:hypothetical protein
MKLTAQHLFDALSECTHVSAWHDEEEPLHLDDVLIDGRFDLEAMAEKLNTVPAEPTPSDQPPTLAALRRVFRGVAVLARAGGERALPIVALEKMMLAHDEAMLARAWELGRDE